MRCRIVRRWHILPRRKRMRSKLSCCRRTFAEFRKLPITPLHYNTQSSTLRSKFPVEKGRPAAPAHYRRRFRKTNTFPHFPPHLSQRKIPLSPCEGSDSSKSLSQQPAYQLPRFRFRQDTSRVNPQGHGAAISRHHFPPKTAPFPPKKIRSGQTTYSSSPNKLPMYQPQYYSKILKPSVCTIYILKSKIGARARSMNKSRITKIDIR